MTIELLRFSTSYHSPTQALWVPSSLEIHETRCCRGGSAISCMYFWPIRRGVGPSSLWRFEIPSREPFKFKGGYQALVDCG
jgi:hypothetical protein